MLAAIADAGGGQYRFIPDPVDCQAELAQVLGAPGDVVAEDVELVLVPANGVELRYVLVASSTRLTAEGLVVSVPDAIDGAEVALAVEMEASFTTDRMRGELLTARVRHRRAGTTERFADEEREALAEEIQSFDRVPSPEQYATFRKHALASGLASATTPTSSRRRQRRYCRRRRRRRSSRTVSGTGA